MDAVTYPHEEVKAELSSWLERRVDITEERQLAAVFEVAAIPTAVLMDHDGRILDRVIGFVEPSDFRKRLSDARGNR